MSSDHELQRAVLAELSRDPRLGASHLGASVRDGVATLTGSVRGLIPKWAAGQATTRVAGVTSVINRIAVKPPVNAELVHDDVFHALHRSWFFDPDTIDVAVEGGDVQLSGLVDSQRDRRVAASTAWTEPGVSGVRNDLVVRPE